MEVEILRLDAGLARAVRPAERPRAAARLRVASCDLHAGPWNPPLGHRPGALGLLVLDGYLIRQVCLAGGTSAEMCGPGDVLRPWDDETASAPLPAQPSWTALTAVRLALLDRRFVATAGEWPDVLVELGSRLIHRARCQSALLAISHVPRLEPRLLALLWHLADRFGTVEAAGIAMPLRLTHETLGALVGGRRPSVSRSMNRLTAAGLVTPRPPGGWWLTGEATSAVDAAGNPGYAVPGEVETAGSASAG